MKTRMKFGDNEIEADGNVGFVQSVTAKFMCKVLGHKRGKRTGVSSSLGIQYQCPRCKAVWNRKAHPRKAKATEKVPPLTLDIRNVG